MGVGVGGWGGGVVSYPPSPTFLSHFDVYLSNRDDLRSILIEFELSILGYFMIDN